MSFSDENDRATPKTDRHPHIQLKVDEDADNPVYLSERFSSIEFHNTESEAEISVLETTVPETRAREKIEAPKRCCKATRRPQEIENLKINIAKMKLELRKTEECEKLYPQNSLDPTCIVSRTSQVLPETFEKLIQTKGSSWGKNPGRSVLMGSTHPTFGITITDASPSCKCNTVPLEEEVPGNTRKVANSANEPIFKKREAEISRQKIPDVQANMVDLCGKKPKEHHKKTEKGKLVTNPNENAVEMPADVGEKRRPKKTQRSVAANIQSTKISDVQANMMDLCDKEPKDQHSKTEKGKSVTSPSENAVEMPTDPGMVRNLGKNRRQNKAHKSVAADIQLLKISDVQANMMDLCGEKPKDHKNTEKGKLVTNHNENAVEMPADMGEKRRPKKTKRNVAANIQSTKISDVQAKMMDLCDKEPKDQHNKTEKGKSVTSPSENAVEMPTDPGMVRNLGKNRRQNKAHKSVAADIQLLKISDVQANMMDLCGEKPKDHKNTEKGKLVTNHNENAVEMPADMGEKRRPKKTKRNVAANIQSTKISDVQAKMMDLCDKEPKDQHNKTEKGKSVTSPSENAVEMPTDPGMVRNLGKNRRQNKAHKSVAADIQLLKISDVQANMMDLCGEKPKDHKNTEKGKLVTNHNENAVEMPADMGEKRRPKKTKRNVAANIQSTKISDVQAKMMDLCDKEPKDQHNKTEKGKSVTSPSENAVEMPTDPGMVRNLGKNRRQNKAHKSVAADIQLLKISDVQANMMDLCGEKPKDHKNTEKGKLVTNHNENAVEMPVDMGEKRRPKKTKRNVAANIQSTKISDVQAKMMDLCDKEPKDQHNKTEKGKSVTSPSENAVEMPVDPGMVGDLGEKRPKKAHKSVAAPRALFSDPQVQAEREPSVLDCASSNPGFQGIIQSTMSQGGKSVKCQHAVDPHDPDCPSIKNMRQSICDTTATVGQAQQALANLAINPLKRQHDDRHHPDSPSFPSIKKMRQSIGDTTATVGQAQHASANLTINPLKCRHDGRDHPDSQSINKIRPSICDATARVGQAQQASANPLKRRHDDQHHPDSPSFKMRKVCDVTNLAEWFETLSI